MDLLFIAQIDWSEGGDYPAQALWNGIREGEGKGLRRTGVRRAAAAAPGYAALTSL